MTDAQRRILAALRTATAALSGEELAGVLGISRAAVHKHVEALREQGYTVEAVHAQGYRLRATPDRLGPEELAPHLTGSWRTIAWHASVDSTQRRAHELAAGGAAEGTFVVAERQTAGRGRLGRTWHSPAGANLYASLILRPAMLPSIVPQLALVAGLSVARAIDDCTGLSAGLKWPNDVVMDGRKVAGILTEMDAEVERVHHVILGIGVNVNLATEALPPELRDKATSLAALAGCPVDRVRFAARLLAVLEDDYRRFTTRGFGALRAEFDARAVLTGRRVTIAGAKEPCDGRVLGVADDGALRLLDDAGVEHAVVAGEVTLPDGYA